MHARVGSFLALLLALAGCAESNPGIEIEGVLAFSDAAMCTLDPGTDPTFLASPTLDTSPLFNAIRPGGIRYAASFQVVNRFLNLGRSDFPIMADPNSFFVEEAEVSLEAIDGSPLDLGDLPTRFRVPASGYVPSAADATEYGRGAVTVEVIPSIYGDALQGRTGTIVAQVQLTGTTSGDSTQTTAEFQMVVSLCDGCLFQCQLDEMSMPINVPSCRPGQDAVSAAAAACGP
ncbi:hypothetical protein [Sandaracinus amylolyticus]|uniref:Lipoprotein n=1 Tax=Sandaracinus amylolyticus TaxID=927083 RepID=A0A0F6W528_9BACT|nr:hypothetical protein [Sandaracinus amylolyticus]AKF07630.1 hypothetical protein DB32_004779 [Sandaracinus amylolyticus]